MERINTVNQDRIDAAKRANTFRTVEHSLTLGMLTTIIVGILTAPITIHTLGPILIALAISLRGDSNRKRVIDLLNPRVLNNDDRARIFRNGAWERIYKLSHRRSRITQ